jgi:hypothetical protein
MSTNSLSIALHSTSVRRWIALGIAVLLTLSGGVLYGSYSQRWNAPGKLASAADELRWFPREIGRWKAVEDIPIEESALEMLECTGYICRRYVNGDTGKSLQLALLIGPPGPIAVHTPEICFSSRAYDIRDERSETSVADSSAKRHSFWKVDFTTRNAFTDNLRVYYAWSRCGEWKASASPRFEFAGAPLLYKIQLATYVNSNVSEEAEDPGRQFLDEFLRYAWTRGESVDGYQEFD